MNREEKLKTLRKRKSELTINGEKFLDGLQVKLEEFKNLFDETISLDGADIDRVITGLSKIDSLSPIVKDLEQSIANLKLPEEVKVTGINDLVKAIQSLKIPDANIKVEFADRKDLGKVITKLSELTKAVKENSFSQAPKDYVPYRRVVYIGNRYIFDDGMTGAGGGGGGGSVQDELIANNAVKVDIQDASITATIDFTDVLLELRVGNGAMNMQVDDTGTTLYQGWAVPGTLTSAASWRIRRVVSSGTPTDTSITFADGNDSFDNIWDNRAALDYTD